MLRPSGYWLPSSISSSDSIDELQECRTECQQVMWPVENGKSVPKILLDLQGRCWGAQEAQSQLLDPTLLTTTFAQFTTLTRNVFRQPQWLPDAPSPRHPFDESPFR